MEGQPVSVAPMAMMTDGTAGSAKTCSWDWQSAGKGAEHVGTDEHERERHLPNWSLRRLQNSTRTASPNRFCREIFISGLKASGLHAGTKRTMLATLDTADCSGFTVQSGAGLAASLNVLAATVSKHWSNARVEGFLLTRYRFNNSSIQQLTWPGGPEASPRGGYVPLGVRPWPLDEELWWLAGAESPGPWGDGPPPF